MFEGVGEKSRLVQIGLQMTSLPKLIGEKRQLVIEKLQNAILREINLNKQKQDLSKVAYFQLLYCQTGLYTLEGISQSAAREKAVELWHKLDGVDLHLKNNDDVLSYHLLAAQITVSVLGSEPLENDGNWLSVSHEHILAAKEKLGADAHFSKKMFIENIHIALKELMTQRMSNPDLRFKSLEHTYDISSDVMRSLASEDVKSHERPLWNLMVAQAEHNHLDIVNEYLNAGISEPRVNSERVWAVLNEYMKNYGGVLQRPPSDYLSVHLQALGMESRAKFLINLIKFEGKISNPSYLEFAIQHNNRILELIGGSGNELVRVKLDAQVRQIELLTLQNAKDETSIAAYRFAQFIAKEIAFVSDLKIRRDLIKRVVGTSSLAAALGLELEDTPMFLRSYQIALNFEDRLKDTFKQLLTERDQQKFSELSQKYDHLIEVQYALNKRIDSKLFEKDLAKESAYSTKLRGDINALQQKIEAFLHPQGRNMFFKDAELNAETASLAKGVDAVIFINICDDKANLFAARSVDDEFTTMCALKDNGLGFAEWQKANWDRVYENNPTGYSAAYNMYCLGLQSGTTNIVHRLSSLFDHSIEKVTHGVSGRLASDICSLLDALNLEHGSTIRIVGPNFLQSVPLHAAVVKGAEKYSERLIDRYSVRFCPVRKISDKKNVSSGGLLFVSRPTRDLPDLLNAVDVKGMEAEVLDGANANKANVLNAIKDKKVVVFICHGVWNPEMPNKSHLVLSNGERLTVEEIQMLDFSSCSSVVLLCCESGLGGELSLSMEPSSLSAAFLKAGAGEVVAAHWPIYTSAASTILENLFTQNDLDNLGSRIQNIQRQMKSGKIPIKVTDNEEDWSTTVFNSLIKAPEGTLDAKDAHKYDHFSPNNAELLIHWAAVSVYG